jgi:hypothetical protein
MQLLFENVTALDGSLLEASGQREARSFIVEDDDGF